MKLPINSNVLRSIKRKVKLLYHSIGSSRECPICGWKGNSFEQAYYPYKPAATYFCQVCGSSERHRFAYFSLKEKLHNYSNTILHFAPETYIESWLRSLSKEYLSVDLYSPDVMRNMDITNLTLEDNSFSLIWCSHVLEHIEDDNKAMTELYRVLNNSGMAVVMVPIYGEKTYEDFSITSPEERLKHFKQEDHVRLYGLDIQQRLEKVGFQVEVLSVLNLPQEIVDKYSLDYPSTREIFLCTKQVN